MLSKGDIATLQTDTDLCDSFNEMVGGRPLYYDISSPESSLTQFAYPMKITDSELICSPKERTSKFAQTSSIGPRSRHLGEWYGATLHSIGPIVEGDGYLVVQIRIVIRAENFSENLRKVRTSCSLIPLSVDLI